MRINREGTKDAKRFKGKKRRGIYMIYPIDNYYQITQKFGENPDWYPTTHGHPGIDFGCPIGTPVRSIFGGQVLFAGMDPETVIKPKTGYGLHVRVLCTQGKQCLAIYGHFSQVLVKQDEQITEGQHIGLTGNTGFSTGPHLHFELRSSTGALTCFDPLPLLNRNQQLDRKPLFYAVVTCVAVMIRRGPNRNQSPLAALNQGDVIPVYSLAGPEVWVEHDRGFSAFRIGGEDLMKIRE
jgi:murein DD-endopeptidase MepM/ murein hydrolase activator NlpD